MSKSKRREAADRTVSRRSRVKPLKAFKPLSLNGLPEGKAQFDASGFKGKRR